MLVGLTIILVAPYTQTLGSAQVSVLRLATLAALATFFAAGGFRPTFIDLVVGVFAIGVVLSWYFEYSHSGRVISIELTPLGFYLGARALSWERSRTAMATMVAAGSLGALTVIYEYLRGHVVFANALSYEWNGRLDALFRPGGVFGSPPGAATVLCFVIFAGFACLTWTSGARRLAIIAALAVCVTAMVLTFTRSGLIGLGAGTLVFLWLTGSRLLRPLPVLWFIVLLGALYVVLFPTLQKSKTFQEGVLRPGTLAARQGYWSIALPIATRNTHNLVLGVGAGALEGPTASGASAPVPLLLAGSPQVVDNSLHNQYITTLLEQGIVGVAALLAMLLCFLRASITGARRLRDPVPAACAAGIVAMATVMTTGTSLLHPPSFVMLLVSGGIAVSWNQRRRDGAPG